MITTVSLKNFTAFKELELNSSSGINILIGENGTGKSHILKVIYTACETSQNSEADSGTFAKQLAEVFKTFPIKLIRMPSDDTTIAHLEVKQKKRNKSFSLSATLSHVKDNPKPALLYLSKEDHNTEKFLPIHSTFIPPKEILSNAPGFRSLYSKREVAFEVVYYDIIDKAFLPPLRDKNGYTTILKKLENVLGGTVTQKGERFYLKTKSGELDFMLLAEGLRKIGLLWLLIQNGSLEKGTILCWDEPEANLNPRLMKVVVEILLELQQMGVQIFLATHSYVLLKEFDLQKTTLDKVRFHALYRNDETKEIELKSTDEYALIEPNAIVDTFADLYDRDLDRMFRTQQ